MITAQEAGPTTSILIEYVTSGARGTASPAWHFTSHGAAGRNSNAPAFGAQLDRARVPTGDSGSPVAQREQSMSGGSNPYYGSALRVSSGSR